MASSHLSIALMTDTTLMAFRDQIGKLNTFRVTRETDLTNLLTWSVLVMMG